MILRIASNMPRALLAGLLVLLLVPAVEAQNVGSPEQVGDTGRLQQRIEELEKRLKEVEERFEKPFTVKAPFTVTDAGGKPFLRADATNGAELTMGSGASPTLRFHERSDRTELFVVDGGNYAGMEVVKSGEAVIGVRGNGGVEGKISVVPGAGVATQLKQGGEIAQLSIHQGNPRVKLWKGNKPFFLVDAATEPTLKLGDEATPAIVLRDSGEMATVDVLKGPSAAYMRAYQSGHGVVDVAGSGGHRAQLLSYPTESSVRVAVGGIDDSALTDVAKLTMSSEGPHLEVIKGGKKTADLGTPEGKHTALRVYDNGGKLALHAGLGSGPDERSSFTLWSGDDAVASLRQDLAGEAVFEIFRDKGQLAAALGRSDKSKQTSLRIFDESGQLAVAAGIDDQNEPAVRIAKDGKRIASMSGDAQGRGRFEVLESGRPLASFGVESNGEPGLTLRHKTGTVAAVLGTLDGEGALDLYQAGGKLSAQLGPAEGLETALRIFGDNATLVAAIGSDDSGNGGVRVANSTGNITASVSGAEGEKGFFVYDSGNKPPLAALTTWDNKGLVAIYNNGTAVSYLTKSTGGDGGNVTVSLNDGFGVFSAGAAQDGAGEACVNRKTQAGTQRLACLGLGLPSAGMGK